MISAHGTLDDFTVGIDIDCQTEQVTVSIEKCNYMNNWFGIVFSDEMIGQALIYTTGNTGAREKPRPLSLYQYNNMAKNAKYVKHDDRIEWFEEEIVRDGDCIDIAYSADIEHSPLTLDQPDVNIRYAFGKNVDEYKLGYHGPERRSDGVLTLSLVTK